VNFVPAVGRRACPAPRLAANPHCGYTPLAHVGGSPCQIWGRARTWHSPSRSAFEFDFERLGIVCEANFCDEKENPEMKPRRGGPIDEAMSAPGLPELRSNAVSEAQAHNPVSLPL